MKLAIGVIRASGGALTDEVRQRAYRLGEGSPSTTQSSWPAPARAKARGGLVVGISPGPSVDEHPGKYRSPVEGFDVLVYTGSGLMGREITNETVNLPEGASREDLAGVYLVGWSLGLKGVTVYRCGFKAGQILTLGLGEDMTAHEFFSECEASACRP